MATDKFVETLNEPWIHQYHACAWLARHGNSACMPTMRSMCQYPFTGPALSSSTLNVQPFNFHDFIVVAPLQPHNSRAASVILWGSALLIAPKYLRIAGIPQMDTNEISTSPVLSRCGKEADLVM